MKIDYELLSEQKQDLLAIIITKKVTKEQIESLDGILNLIDGLEDQHEGEAIA